MIVQFFLDVLSGLVDWILSFWGTQDLADWVYDGSEAITSVLGFLSGLGVWVDWVLVGAVVGTVISIWLTAFTVKLVLRIVSHLPWVGGAG